jgi:pyruvate kinase
MLSGETAVGDDPALVVNTMDRIIRRVESSFDYESTWCGCAQGDTPATSPRSLATTP